MATPTLTLCALCYGNYRALARRCLGSLAILARRPQVAPFLRDVRVGLNDVDAATEAEVRFAATSSELPWWGYRPDVTVNPVWKYPIMRLMLYGPLPFAASHVGWLDDDSYFDSDCSDTKFHDWWEAFVARLPRVDLAGYRYSIASRPRQLAGFREQPWWVEGRARVLNNGRTGRDSRVIMSFVTGGLWFARHDALSRWDYPFPELLHNGGDSALGLLAACQGWQIFGFPGAGRPGQHFLVCNAEKRRGGATRWPWEGYPDTKPTYDHLDFDYTLEPLNDAATALGSLSKHRSQCRLPRGGQL